MQCACIANDILAIKMIALQYYSIVQREIYSAKRLISRVEKKTLVATPYLV